MISCYYICLIIIHRFETSKGMIRDETGRRVNIGQADEHIAVQGFYSYNDTEGVLQSVHYKADKNGYVIIDPFAGAVNILIYSLSF